MPFLNVVYGGTSTEIKTDGIERISELQDLIKAKYGEFIAAPPAAIKLYKSDEGEKSDALVTDLEDIPEEYFKKRKDGGLALEIRTSPPLSAPENSLVGQVLSVSINQNKLMKKYLTPVGSVSNTPIESSPSSVDISDIGLELEQQMFYRSTTARPCIVLDVQRRSEDPQPGESPPITIALITGFDGKPLSEVMAKEEFNRVAPIHPTPMQEGITINSPIHTTPEWLPHPMRKTPSYVLCIPIKVFPQNLCAFQDIIQLDADNFHNLKLHILFLGNVIANAEYEDSEFEDSDDDGEIQLGEWNRTVNWDEVTV